MEGVASTATVTPAIIEVIKLKILKNFIFNKIYLLYFNILLFDMFSKIPYPAVAVDTFVKSKKLCLYILLFDNFILLKLK